MTNILYIHGFKSSPLSFKAEQTRLFIEQAYPDFHYHCPQLDISPKIAVEQLATLIEQSGPIASQHWYLIGSSLGGYYASYLAEKYGLKAALINPAVKPYDLLVDYIGEQKSYHSTQVLDVKASYMDDLKNIEQLNITKKNYLVMVQTGDEVLDYQQATEKYQQCQLVIEQGGDHSFINFQEHLPDIMRFFELSS
ncbi:MAG: YqiA/YcfP family alpha/beta fold hydrolase [Thalassotalea sp.]